MTIVLPLQRAQCSASIPAFVSASPDPNSQTARVISVILKAKRLVVISGAGISVQAGIPDFRSSDGLFQTLKRDNPKEALSSGKDLFDASVFTSEHTTSLFCQMTASLYRLSQAAKPTPFHYALRTLHDQGRLLRVYTQNIDALEIKCGLPLGIPDFGTKRQKPRSKAIKLNSTVTPVTADMTRLPTPPAEIPRCIPLHGTLQTMQGQTCTHTFPLEHYIHDLSAGRLPLCPTCGALEDDRLRDGKRARGVGRLRPSVVLYNEDHKDAEAVGEAVRKDLLGSSKKSGADLLLVVGTSLRVPGTKRMVREFAKSTKFESGLATPTSSPRRTPSSDDDIPIRTVFINLDFPVPVREWEGVFDVWLQGDVQQFAAMLSAAIEEERVMKTPAAGKKRKRDDDLPVSPPTPPSVVSSGARAHKPRPSSPSRPAKKRRHQRSRTPSSLKIKIKIPPHLRASSSIASPLPLLTPSPSPEPWPHGLSAG